MILYVFGVSMNMNNETENQQAKDILRAARNIELKCRRLSDSRMHGSYLSVFKGRGLEFTEIREYMSGDDVRAIDWNVTARMGYPHIKEFVEERDICVYLLVDVSGSFDFGTQKALKREVAAELCASVAYSALKNNDLVGMVLFSDRVEKFIKPAKGRKHMTRLVHEILKIRPGSRQTGLKEPLAFLSNVIKQRSIVFIISDFIDDTESYSKYLGCLAKENDVIAIDLYDDRELEMPDVGLIELEDEETGEQMIVDTSDPEFISAFEENVVGNRKRIVSLMRKKRIDRLEVSTSCDWVSSLSGFFRSRSKRRSCA